MDAGDGRAARRKRHLDNDALSLSAASVDLEALRATSTDEVAHRRTGGGGILSSSPQPRKARRLSMDQGQQLLTDTGAEAHGAHTRTPAGALLTPQVGGNGGFFGLSQLLQPSETAATARITPQMERISPVYRQQVPGALHQAAPSVGRALLDPARRSNPTKAIGSARPVSKVSRPRRCISEPGCSITHGVCFVS